MFQNIIMPQTTTDDLRGLMALLSLIATPESADAASFLATLSEEKDAAVAAAVAAKEDRDEAEGALESAHQARQDMDGQLRDTLAAARTKLALVEETARQWAARDDALRASEAAHADALIAHKDRMTTADLAMLTRENAATAREQKLARDTADLLARQAEFERHMAPVLAAAKAAR